MLKVNQARKFISFFFYIKKLKNSTIIYKINNSFYFNLRTLFLVLFFKTNKKVKKCSFILSFQKKK